MSAHNPKGRRSAQATWALAGSIAIIAAATGCAQHHVAMPPIKIASAYVMQSSGASAVAAYLVIANSGPADRLLSVRSSAGGHVFMVGPDTQGPAATSALSDLTVAGHGLTRLDPSGYHLEIIRSGRLHQGTDLTLTLVFAHAGTIDVPAQVNNPGTNNGGYLGP